MDSHYSMFLQFLQNLQSSSYNCFFRRALKLHLIHLVLGAFQEGCSAGLVFNLLYVLFWIFSPAPPHVTGFYMAFQYHHRISRETIKACFEGGCFCSCHLIQYAVLLHSNPLSDSPIIFALSFYSAEFLLQRGYPC